MIEQQEQDKVKYIPYQCCPKCNGQGIVSKPPYVAGDVHEWSSTSTSFTCDVCSGTKVIPMVEDISIIRSTLSLFFKWHYLQVELNEILQRKTSAIKQQRYSEAGILRDDELAKFAELTKVNSQLKDMSEKLTENG